MPRAFLAWVAALTATSWAGMLLAELGVFSAAAAIAVGVAAVATCTVLLRDAAGAWRLERPAGWLLPLVALALAATLLPTVDTTLLSEDASIHRASGRWLAREGGFGIPDPSFAPLGEDARLQLFGGASVSPFRLSLTRLPGGIVLPDLTGTVAYPSFSHLLAVWIAIAERAGGERAVALLGPLFAVTAWWAVALLALLDAGLLAALLAPLLLAALFPEHWFARFLMPEMLAQALVWCGVAAARLAEVDGVSRRARVVAAVLCGTALGVSGFARLEQFWVFVPALLLARVLVPRQARVLPRYALPAFVVAAGHAVLHAVLVPTDYMNRIYKAVITVFATFVVFLSGLSGNNGYVTGFVLNRVLPVVLLTALVLWLWIGRRIDRRRPGFLRRWSAAAIALPWLALLYHEGVPEQFAALRSLLLYVPWVVWIAVALGLLRRRAWSGLEIALVLQAIDQIIQARVTDLQPWASRRLVTVVLPVVVLAAVRALAPAGDADRGVRHARPRRERVLAAGAVVLTIVLAAARVAPVFRRPIQAGGDALVRQIAGVLPPSAYVILAEPLGGAHLAAALWLGEGRTTLVAREQPWFPPALAQFLALPEQRARPLYVLAGGMTAAGEPEPAPALPPLPPGFQLEPVATFGWPTTLLEDSADSRPEVVREHSLTLALYRVQRPGA
jgi:hypothetical protein